MGSGRPRERLWPVVVTIVAIVVIAGGVLLWRAIQGATRIPEFPSLVDTPDSSLHGTVAYLDWSYPGCLHVVSASGSYARDLGCPGGTNLMWLPDGRLQIWPYTGAEVPGGAGQPIFGKIFDVTAGTSEDMASSDIPPQSGADNGPILGPNGERVTVSKSGDTIELATDGPSGSTTLLSIPEAGEQYEMTVWGWSPDGAWVMMYDSAARLLIVTTSKPSTARVLATEIGQAASVFGEDLLGG